MRLHIFPEQGLDSSIITPVLIGLVTLFLLTEFLGWVFVGYVVPGYLAAVFLAFPTSGTAIVIEAILTYIFVYAVSEGGAKLKLWARFFGREGFLLFVYLSVIVRLIMESFLFARVSTSLRTWFGIELGGEFFSIGLVLVPLLANSFWKIGLSRGLVQSGFITLVTYAVLAFVLVPYTNLNVSKFELTYENLALDFIASPKLYIILLCGALIASTYNLRYGWDYNGIMMPALLAIAFFMPSKVLSTCGESVVVAGIFSVLTKLPVLRDINFGGGRKVVAVFIVGYITKWLLAVILPESWGMSVTDLFGFGYVLPSMLAVKILQKRKVFVVLLPTLNAAVYAVVTGSLIAAAFQVAGNLYLGPEDRRTDPADLIQQDVEGVFLRDLLTAKAFVLRGGHAQAAEPKFGQSEWVSRHVVKIIESDDPLNACQAMTSESPPDGTQEMECLMRHDETLGPYLVVRERVVSAMDRRGQGVYFVRPKAKGPVLAVPHPVSEAFSLEAAYVALSVGDARALYLAGVDEPLSDDEWTDALKGRGTTFQRVYERLAGKDVVLVRSVSDGAGAVHSRSALPASLSINELRNRFGTIELFWAPPEPPPVQWNTGPGVDLSLITLPTRAVYKAFPKEQMAVAPTRLETRSSITGLIERWVVEQKNFIHDPSTGLYTPPRWDELELLESEVVHRALLLAHETDDAEFAIQLSALRMVAGFLGYEVVWFTDTGSSESYLILKEFSDFGETRGWGTIVVSLSALAHPWFWIVPRPLSETGALGLGARWFEQYGGRLLFVPGADWRADAWGKSDILSPAAPRTAAHAVLSEFVRARGGETEFLALVVRGTSNESLKEPVLLSSGDEIVDEAQLVEPTQSLLADLRRSGQHVGVFRGLPEQMGLQGLGNPLSGLVRVRRPGHYVTLWIADSERRAVFEGRRLDSAAAIMEAFGVPFEMNETTALREQLAAGPSVSGRASLQDAEIAELVLDFASTSNSAALASLAKAKGVSVRAFADLRATEVYLIAETAGIRCVGTLGKGGYEFNRTISATAGDLAAPHCLVLSRSRAQVKR